MTTLFLIYELKVALLIAVFYIFWRLLVANETWHRLNRIVLLSTAIASFVLPLCVITIHQTVEVDPIPMESTAETALPETIAIQQEAEMTSVPIVTEPEQTFNWLLLLTIIYIIGVMVVLSRTAFSLWRLHKITLLSEIHPLSNGRQIAISEEAKTPFSWWKTVFLNHNDFAEGTTALLTHELGHIQLHHSVDVLLVELLTALQWFNPTMWMLRADLRTIHEYEADQQVLSHGFDDIQYLHLLIRKAASQGGYSLANGFINSTLKKRISMMTKPKSSRRQWLKIAYILPIVAISLYASCETKTDYKTKEESALILTMRGDSVECWGVKAPAGAFYSWLVNGQLAERGVVEEDGRWNVLTLLPTESYVTFLDGKEINKDDVPYIPLSSIKELKFTQGEMPRSIELYTSYVSGFSRENQQEWPDEFKEKQKHWAFVRVQDAATGRQLEGAAVSIEGTNQKILTNAEGWCELKVPLGSTLKVEYKGMEPQSRRIDVYNGSIIQGYTFSLYQPGEPIYYINELSKDQEPVFPGDQEQWLAKNTQLPKAADGEGISGHVGIWLVVNEDGSVSGVRLKQGVNKVLNDEALRLFRSMPRWRPAMKDGKAVKCLVLSSVSFKNVQDNVLIGACIRDGKTQKYLNDVNAELLGADNAVLSKPMVQEVVRGSKMYRYVWSVPRQSKYIIRVSKQGYNTESIDVSISASESQKIAGDIILSPTP
ncbi:MAG: carboxypeptidase-like regulatory domain-containing protein [Prevotella sp.]|nr:carboxypeptidase-like regulatory domain-containing protein [Prevotella sp.]MBR1556402.1 carboxypeptidase-like regulatory domain-containing protein [Prevotella sp.]